MAKKVTSQIEVEQIRNNLAKLHEGLGKFVETVSTDHAAMPVCTGYPEFQKESPKAYLERSTNLLARKGYKVAFVGPFKAGKSTFLSALLQQPGMLPAEDAECTFAVGVISAPGLGEGEHVEVTYYKPEEVLNNIVNHTRYYKLYQTFDEARHNEVKNNPTEDVALGFLNDCGTKGRQGELGEEAGEILNFISAYKEYKGRLGLAYNDSIQNLPKYVRKEEGIGHLLLIKLVHIYMNNPVLQKQGFSIADTPGTDSMNDAAKVITLDYLKEADAVIYLAEARGLSTNFNVIREELKQYNNSIRNKMFIVANKADVYETKSMVKPAGGKAPIEVVFDQIVNPLRALGLDDQKLYFTAGRISELNFKKAHGGLTDQEQAQYETLSRAINEKLKVLSSDINPHLLKALQTCFKDGGVDHFRQVLIDYLDIDIQVERLREIFTDLARVHKAARTLLEPERERMASALENIKTQGMQVTEFFDNLRGTFSDKASAISRAVENVTSTVMDKIKQQIQDSFSKAIDRFNIERIKVHMPVQVPVKIKMEVIDQLKGLLSERFATVVRDSMAPVVKSKLHQLINEAKVPDAVKIISTQLKSRHGFELEHILEEFDRNIDQFTMMRAGEETWELQSSEIKPGAFDAQWTPQVEQKFREQLKKLFVDRFVQYTGKLGYVIGRHYQALLSDLVTRFDKLCDEISTEVKKDPDRVQLPGDILGAGAAETDDERKARALVGYFKIMDAVGEAYDGVAEYLG